MTPKWGIIDNLKQNQYSCKKIAEWRGSEITLNLLNQWNYSASEWNIQNSVKIRLVRKVHNVEK